MIDVIVVVLLVGAGVFGWLRGLVQSLLGTGVFIAGGAVGAVVASIAGAAGALGFLFGGAIAMVPLAVYGAAITERVAAAFDDQRLRLADRALGSLVNVVVATCIAWFVAAVTFVVPGSGTVVDACRSSLLLGTLAQVVPPDGAVGVVVLRSGLVHGVDGPLVIVGEPNAQVTSSPAIRRAAESVVEVRSTACQELVTGSGWVTHGRLIVTNAHVVAGSTRSWIASDPRASGIEARVVARDIVHDIAVLAPVDAAAPLPAPLTLSVGVRHGEDAAVVGYPKGGARHVEPARIDRVTAYEVQPVASRDRVASTVLAFRAIVQPGNSGGPVVRSDGSVAGIVVSQGMGQRFDAAYGAPADAVVRAISAAAARTPVDTGRCLASDDLHT